MWSVLARTDRPPSYRTAWGERRVERTDWGTALEILEYEILSLIKFSFTRVLIIVFS